jgi:hypothetical protein
MTATSITATLPTMPWFARNDRIRANIRGLHIPALRESSDTIGANATTLALAAPRSEYDIVRAALSDYNELIRLQGLTRSKSRLEAFVHVAYACAVNNGPKMQVRLIDSATVEVLWVVGDYVAGAAFPADGSVSLWAEYAQELEIDWELAEGEFLSPQQREALATFFTRAAPHVSFDA